MSFPQYVKDWLNNRFITDEILSKASLYWNGHEIVIPVRQANGTLRFNKYRRDPRRDNGAKYTYDKGAYGALYGVDQGISPKKSIYICEGELDSLVLRSQGLQAVSTTGGSSTFSDKWVNYFDPEQAIYIVYDADLAGYKGALNVYRLFRQNKFYNLNILLLPAGQDVTDFFVSGKTLVHFHDIAATRPVRIEHDLETLEGLQAAVYELNDTLASEPDLRDEYRGFYETTRDQLQNELVQRTRPKSLSKIKSDDLDDIKQIAITDIVEFNRRGFSACVFHHEKTASMKYYADKNVVHCFGCGVTRNVIQVYAQINYGDTTKESWKKALNDLKQKYGKG